VRRWSTWSNDFSGEIPERSCDIRWKSRFKKQTISVSAPPKCKIKSTMTRRTRSRTHHTVVNVGADMDADVDVEMTKNGENRAHGRKDVLLVPEIRKEDHVRACHCRSSSPLSPCGGDDSGDDQRGNGRRRCRCRSRSGRPN
jgi:hypothetical protein